MNPKPFASLNHLTVPMVRAIATTPRCVGYPRRPGNPAGRALVSAGLSRDTKRRKDPGRSARAFRFLVYRMTGGKETPMPKMRAQICMKQTFRQVASDLEPPGRHPGQVAALPTRPAATGCPVERLKELGRRGIAGVHLRAKRAVQHLPQRR